MTMTCPTQTSVALGVALLGFAMGLVGACATPNRDFLEFDQKEEVDAGPDGPPTSGACGAERKALSIIVVNNNTPGDVSVFEVTPDCRGEEFRGTAAAGGGVSVSVFKGYTYRVRDKSGALLLEFQRDTPGSVNVP
jgi:hypothetical protein